MNVSTSLITSTEPYTQWGKNNSSSAGRVIYDNDDRKDACAIKKTEPIKYKKSLAVAEISYNSHPSYSGTTFRITKENFMLTNSHVIPPGSDIKDYSINFNDGCGNNTIVSVGKILARNEKLDYVLFSINEDDFPKIKRYGYLGIDQNGAKIEEDIYIPQHAIKENKNTENKKTINDKTISMYERVQGLYETKDKPGRVLYTSDTTPGSSGAPVISEKTNKVVALNYGYFVLNEGINIKNIWSEIKGVIRESLKKDDGTEHLSYSDLYNIFTDSDTYSDERLSDAIKILSDKDLNKAVDDTISVSMSIK